MALDLEPLKQVQVSWKGLTRNLWKESTALLPLYLEHKTSWIRIKNIPPEVKVAWIVATLLFGGENKINIIQISRDAPQNWRRQTLEILVKATSTDQENLPRKIHIRKDIALIVNVEGRRLRCFMCRKRNTWCPIVNPPRKQQKEKRTQRRLRKPGGSSPSQRGHYPERNCQ